MEEFAYYVMRWHWNGSEGYDPETIFESKTEQEAREFFDKFPVNIDDPCVELWEIGEDDNILIDRKEAE